MNEVPHPGFDKPEEYETFTTTNYLEEAAEEWCKVNHKGIALCADKKSHYLAEGADAFKAGAKWQKKRDEEAIKTAEDHAFLAGADWQKEQFEKNRLANCDKLTKEEYDRETDFAMEIIEKEHRQPTFTDAINYGMRATKEYLMKEAVEGFFTKSIDGDVVFAESTALDVDPKSVKVGDKVKLIVIKEDDK